MLKMIFFFFRGLGGGKKKWRLTGKLKSCIDDFQSLWRFYSWSCMLLDTVMASLVNLFFPWLFDTFLLLLDKADRWLGLLCKWYTIVSQLCLFFITCNYTSMTKITTQCLDESKSWKRKKGTVWSQTNEDRWYPGGFLEEVYSLLENSYCQTDLKNW